jgi:hypothetical protein
MYAVAVEYVSSLTILEVDPKTASLKVTDILNYYYYAALRFGKFIHLLHCEVVNEFIGVLQFCEAEEVRGS